MSIILSPTWIVGVIVCLPIPSDHPLICFRPIRRVTSQPTTNGTFEPFPRCTPIPSSFLFHQQLTVCPYTRPTISCMHSPATNHPISPNTTANTATSSISSDDRETRNVKRITNHESHITSPKILKSRGSSNRSFTCDPSHTPEFQIQEAQRGLLDEAGSSGAWLQSFSWCQDRR